MHDMRINFSTEGALESPFPGGRQGRCGAAGGSRRVKPGPGRGAGVVLLLLLLLVESKGVGSEGWEATGMSPIFHVLSPHRAVGVVTQIKKSRVVERGTSPLQRITLEVAGAGTGTRRRPGRNTLGETAGAPRTWPPSGALLCGTVPWPTALMAHGHVRMCPCMRTELHRIHRAYGRICLPVCLCVD